MDSDIRTPSIRGEIRGCLQVYKKVNQLGQNLRDFSRNFGYATESLLAAAVPARNLDRGIGSHFSLFLCLAGGCIDDWQR